MKNPQDQDKTQASDFVKKYDRIDKIILNIELQQSIEDYQKIMRDLDKLLNKKKPNQS